MTAKSVLIISNVVAIVVGGAISYFVFNDHPKLALNTAKPDTAKMVADGITQAFNQSYAASDNIIRPVLFMEGGSESQHFATLKATIQNLIEDYKRNGKVGDASVYFADLNTTEWIDCNPTLAYDPGSLAKVPLMLTYLRVAENDKALLDKKVVAEHLAVGAVPTQTYNGKQIVPGKTYTIRELLTYMISYSDNLATYMLHQNMDIDNYLKTFKDLGVKAPVANSGAYLLTAREYSRFLRVLYNASYLSKPKSQLAIDLMNNDEFKNGIARKLPSDVRIVHKFGEFGNKAERLHEFHEAAVVYFKDSPYILTIMTKGTAEQDLPLLISEISLLVYQYMSKGS
jgi:beta-lactamase class A